MAFTLVHRDGTQTEEPPLDAVLLLLAELDGGVGQVAVRHQVGWTLRIHADGVVEFVHERSREVPVRHSTAVTGAALLELAEAVAVGSFYETLEHEWREGPRPSPVERA